VISCGDEYETYDVSAMKSVTMRRLLRKLVPNPVLDFRTRYIHSNRRYRDLTTAQTFSEIYKRRLWGVEPNEAFDSGEGSGSEFATRYSQMIREFAEEHNVKKIVDLGCGDFRVGRLLADKHAVKYVGVDVVPELIDYNRQHFGGADIHFECLDITNDDLPDGDLCLIRQVLQHLSNPEIARILSKCEKYEHIIVTEHVYSGPGLRPNLDRPHGPDIRVVERSGVYLNEAPFNCLTQTLLEMPCSPVETLRSVAVEFPGRYL
jgi:SAM-dependent methyltransferase